MVQLDQRFLYSYKEVQLPVDGLMPQPVVPVVKGFSCHFCRYLTISRPSIRKHANKEHLKQYQADDDLFAHVCLQSWYGSKRERYWIVSDNGKEVENSTRESTERFNDKIEEDIHRWTTEVTERRLTVEVKPLPYAVDAWVNFTKWQRLYFYC